MFTSESLHCLGAFKCLILMMQNSVTHLHTHRRTQPVIVKDYLNTLIDTSLISMQTVSCFLILVFLLGRIIPGPPVSPCRHQTEAREAEAPSLPSSPRVSLGPSGQ